MKYKINQYVRNAFLKAKAIVREKANAKIKNSSSVASRALLTALATFTVLAPLGSAQAIEVDANQYQALYGDINGDGLNDIYLTPKPKYIPIAGEVLVFIPLAGDGDSFKLLAQASGYATPELDSSVDIRSLSSGYFQLLSGDFNGDGVEDTFVQSTTSSLLSLTLANNLVENTPYVLQTFASFASDTHSLAISDLNDDGRDDITYTVNSQSQSHTLYASNLGHLQSAGQGQVSANYGYDYLNKRRYKVVEKIGEPRQEVIYIDDHTELRDGKLQKYITLGGQKIARSSQASGEFTPAEFYLNNHLGSIALTLDASANVKNAFTYEPYGDKQMAYGEPDLAPYGFTGKEQDPETQLGYFHHRYLNTKVGQFITPDPVFAMDDRFVDPQLWSPYAYGRNNPIVYTDPDGLKADLFESNQRHEAAVQQMAKTMRARGLMVEFEVSIRVNMGDGTTAIRYADLVGRKTLKTYEGAEFVEIKTVKDGKKKEGAKNFAKSVARKLNRATAAFDDVSKIATKVVRGGTAVVQIKRDVAFNRFGGTVIKTNEAVKSGTMNWHIYEHSGTVKSVKKKSGAIPVKYGNKEAATNLSNNLIKSLK